MRFVAAGVPLILVLASCGPGRQGGTAVDSAAAEAEATAAPSADTTPAPPMDLVARDVRQACDKVSAYWARHPNAAVRAFDSVLTLPRSRSTADACWVTVRIEKDTDRPGDGPRVPFAAEGWVQLWEFQADGPDGGSTVFQLVPVRCLVEERWDGGDDSDSTYVPAPWFEQRVACWRR